MRPLTKEEVDEVLKLRQNDITNTLLKDYFGRTVEHPEPRFNTTDYFMLPENACAKNLPGFTTLGMYIFNRLVIEERFADVTGYVNTPITGGTLKKVYNLISQALFDDKITTEHFFELIDSLDWLGGGDISELINVSLTPKIFMVPAEVRKRRAELFKQYAKELDAGDVIVAAKIEKELVELAKKHLSKLPEWDNFASDAKLNFDNNYKTMMLMKGPVVNTGTGEWVIAKSNYDDGIDKKEYASFADSAVSGTFQRAKGVAMGGYTVKKFIATLQDITAGEPGSDCGTDGYLEMVIDPFFRNELMGMYIIEGSKLVMISPDNFNKYAGKRVKLRSPEFCRYPDPHICNKCLGEQPYQLGLKAVGIAATKIGSTMMNKRLKAFHNKKVEIYRVTVDDLLED